MTASAAVQRLARMSRVPVALTGPGESAELTRARLVVLLDGGRADGALEDALAALEPEGNEIAGAATASGDRRWASAVADGDGPWGARGRAGGRRDDRARRGAPPGANGRHDRRRLGAAVGNAGPGRDSGGGPGAAAAETGRDGGGARGARLGSAGAVTGHDDGSRTAAAARRPGPVPRERRRSRTPAGEGRAGGGRDDRGPVAAGSDDGSAADLGRFGVDVRDTRTARGDGDPAADDHGGALPPLSRLAALGAATPVARGGEIIVAAENRSAPIATPAEPPRPQAARAEETRPPAIIETAPARSPSTAETPSALVATASPADSGLQALVATASPAGSGLQAFVAWWEGHDERGRSASSAAPDDQLTARESFRGALEDVLVSEAHASGIEVRP